VPEIKGVAIRLRPALPSGFKTLRLLLLLLLLLLRHC
jgi:hypothetical protein